MWIGQKSQEPSLRGIPIRKAEEFTENLTFGLDNTVLSLEVLKKRIVDYLNEADDFRVIHLKEGKSYNDSFETVTLGFSLEDS